MVFDDEGIASFARASEDLQLGRTSTTTAVAQLEKHLGVRLLHRTTRRLSLTEDGRAFYERCVRLLSDLAEAEDMLSSARISPRGRLRISTPHSFVNLVLFDSLPRFLARHPDLQLEVFLTDRTVNLVEEGIDCALRATEIPDDATLVAREILSARWLTCASPAYLGKHGTPRRVEDLEHHNCVRFISQSTGRVVDWQFQSGEERTRFTPRGNLAVSALEAAVASAVLGIGIAQVSDALALPALRAGNLTPVLFDQVARGPSLNLVYPSNRYLTAKVRAFGDFAAEVFPRDGWWDEILAIAHGTIER